MRCFKVIIFSSLGVLAGCATTPTQHKASMEQGYAGQIVAIRSVTGGALTMQITKILGQPEEAPLTAGQEVVVRLTDGEVKDFVPPQGTMPTGLMPGDHIIITETPVMRISRR